jgi:hypothetical protein
MLFGAVRDLLAVGAQRSEIMLTSPRLPLAPAPAFPPPVLASNWLSFALPMTRWRRHWAPEPCRSCSARYLPHRP